jgi:hypothetical protein
LGKLRHLENPVFGKLLSIAIQWEFSIGKSFYPAIAYPHLDSGMNCVVQSKSQQTLLPIGDYLVSTKLVFCMKTKLIGEFEGSKIGIPSDLIGRVKPIVLPKCWVEK